MKILIDMNLSPSWARVLNEAGMEAIHWSDVGPATTPDPAIMAYATANGFVILTNDLDFGIALAIANREKPSVAQIRGEDLQTRIHRKSGGAGLAPDAGGVGSRSPADD